MKIYPNAAGDTKKKKKAKKGEDAPEEKKSNLQITDKGVVAVQEFNIDIADKEFIVLVGPSGCGKSTTLRMIAGLEEISEGEVIIDGRVVNDVPPKDRDIAMVFQNYALYPHMTVYENMAFSLKLKKVDKKTIDEKVREAAEILDITQYLDRKPKALSGGQRQRVAIGRAIVREPKVFLMDEPLSNLDAKLRLEMRSELQRLHIDTGSTFIYVTHDQMEAMTLATKICLIDNGVLQQYDAPLDVYNRPNSLFVADFVGNPAINFIEATGKQRPDGGIALDMLGGVSATFTPNEKLDLAKWFRDEDAKDEAKRAREAELAKDKKHVEKANKDTVFRCHIPMVNEAEDFGDEESPTDGDFIIGVRPEFIKLSDSGAIEGEIYSAMPTGMETTVRIKIGDYLLTGVVFGGVLYKIGEKVRLDFDGSGVVLFSRRNGRLISLGSVELK